MALTRVISLQTSCPHTMRRKPEKLRRSYTDEGDVLHEPLLPGPGSDAGDAGSTGGGGSSGATNDRW